jgi:hypothetical protein
MRRTPFAFRPSPFALCLLPFVLCLAILLHATQSAYGDEEFKSSGVEEFNSSTPELLNPSTPCPALLSNSPTLKLSNSRTLPSAVSRNVGAAEPELDAARADARQYIRRLRSIFDVVVLAAALAVVIWFLTQNRTVRSRLRSYSLARPVPQLLTICNETVTLDHIFVAKGQLAGAVSRIKEMRVRCGLSRDPDLRQVRDRIEPYYSQFIQRLVNQPGTANVFSEFAAMTRALAIQHANYNLATMTREQFQSRVRQNWFTGHWLVKIQNWDCPDIFDRLRIYYDGRAMRYLEHWLADNSRHARSWSVVALDYTVNTMWNRKATVRFYNDGSGVIDRNQPRSNIAFQLQEIVHDYASFLEVPQGPADLDLHEKIWFRFWDFISILEDIHARQTKLTGRTMNDER